MYQEKSGQHKLSQRVCAMVVTRYLVVLGDRWLSRKASFKALGLLLSTCSLLVGSVSAWAGNGDNNRGDPTRGSQHGGDAGSVLRAWGAVPTMVSSGTSSENDDMDTGDSAAPVASVANTGMPDTSVLPETVAPDVVMVNVQTGTLAGAGMDDVSAASQTAYNAPTPGSSGPDSGVGATQSWDLTDFGGANDGMEVQDAAVPTTLAEAVVPNLAATAFPATASAANDLPGSPSDVEERFDLLMQQVNQFVTETGFLLQRVIGNSGEVGPADPIPNHADAGPLPAGVAFADMDGLDDFVPPQFVEEAMVSQGNRNAEAMNAAFQAPLGANGVRFGGALAGAGGAGDPSDDSSDDGSDDGMSADNDSDAGDQRGAVSVPYLEAEDAKNPPLCDKCNVVGSALGKTFKSPDLPDRWFVLWDSASGSPYRSGMDWRYYDDARDLTEGGLPVDEQWGVWEPEARVYYPAPQDADTLLFPPCCAQVIKMDNGGIGRYGNLFPHPRALQHLKRLRMFDMGEMLQRLPSRVWRNDNPNDRLENIVAGAPECLDPALYDDRAPYWPYLKALTLHVRGMGLDPILWDNTIGQPTAPRLERLKIVLAGLDEGYLPPLAKVLPQLMALHVRCDPEAPYFVLRMNEDYQLTPMWASSGSHDVVEMDPLSPDTFVGHQALRSIRMDYFTHPLFFMGMPMLQSVILRIDKACAFRHNLSFRDVPNLKQLQLYLPDDTVEGMQWENLNPDNLFDFDITVFPDMNGTLYTIKMRDASQPFPDCVFSMHGTFRRSDYIPSLSRLAWKTLERHGLIKPPQVQIVKKNDEESGIAAAIKLFGQDLPTPPPSPGMDTNNAPLIAQGELPEVDAAQDDSDEGGYFVRDLVYAEARDDHIEWWCAEKIAVSQLQFTRKGKAMLRDELMLWKQAKEDAPAGTLEEDLTIDLSHLNAHWKGKKPWAPAYMDFLHAAVGDWDFEKGKKIKGTKRLRNPEDAKAARQNAPPQPAWKPQDGQPNALQKGKYKAGSMPPPKPKQQACAASALLSQEEVDAGKAKKRARLNTPEDHGDGKSAVTAAQQGNGVQVSAEVVNDGHPKHEADESVEVQDPRQPKRRRPATRGGSDAGV